MLSDSHNTIKRQSVFQKTSWVLCVRLRVIAIDDKSSTYIEYLYKLVVWNTVELYLVVKAHQRSASYCRRTQTHKRCKGIELRPMSMHRSARHPEICLKFLKAKMPTWRYLPSSCAEFISSRVGAARIWATLLDAARSNVLWPMSVKLAEVCSKISKAYLSTLIRMCHEVYDADVWLPFILRKLLRVKISYGGEFSQLPRWSTLVPDASTSLRRLVSITRILVSKTVADVRRPTQTTGRQVFELIFIHQDTKFSPKRRNASGTQSFSWSFGVSLPEISAWFPRITGMTGVDLLKNRAEECG